MKEYLQKFDELLQKYGKFLPYITTLFPFILGYASVLIFAQGDMRSINYFISEIGIINFWLNGLVTLLTIVVQLVLASFLVDYWFNVLKPGNKTSNVKIIVGGLITGIALSILSLAFVIGTVLGLLIGTVTAFMMIRRANKTGKVPTKIISKNLYIFLGVFVLYTSITSYPNLPITRLELSEGKKVDVTVLSRQQDYYLVQNKDDRKVVKIKHESVKNETICASSDSLSSTTLISLLTHRKSFQDCT